MALQDPTTRAPLDALAAGAEFEAQLVEHIPLLRVYALSLSGRREFAEDLAQEALAKAWRARGSFTPGSNLKAWLYVILRNEYHSRQRRSWRQAPWEPALGEMIAAPQGQQQWAAELSDLACAMRGLSKRQREALILVGAGGFSHDDAAALSNTPVGTVKSRVGRARRALKKMVDGETSLPRKSRPAIGDAMDDILAQLSHLCTGRPQRTWSPAPGHS